MKNNKKLKLSTIYGILTLVFVLPTIAGAVYIFTSKTPVSQMWGFVPCVIALVFSSLMVRARNEGK